MGADTPDDRREVADHLGQCPPCRAESDELRIVCAYLSLLPDDEIESIVEGLADH